MKYTYFMFKFNILKVYASTYSLRALVIVNYDTYKCFWAKHVGVLISYLVFPHQHKNL